MASFYSSLLHTGSNKQTNEVHPYIAQHQGVPKYREQPRNTVTEDNREQHREQTLQRCGLQSTTLEQYLPTAPGVGYSQSPNLKPSKYYKFLPFPLRPYMHNNYITEILKL